MRFYQSVWRKKSKCSNTISLFALSSGNSFGNQSLLPRHCSTSIASRSVCDLSSFPSPIKPTVEFSEQSNGCAIMHFITKVILTARVDHYTLPVSKTNCLTSGRMVQVDLLWLSFSFCPLICRSFAFVRAKCLSKKACAFDQHRGQMENWKQILAQMVYFYKELQAECLLSPMKSNAIKTDEPEDEICCIGLIKKGRDQRSLAINALLC